jgi:hypothetical protein
MSLTRFALIAFIGAGVGSRSVAAQRPDSTAAVQSTMTGTVVRLDTLRMDAAHNAHHDGANAHHQTQHAMMTRGGGGLALALLSGTDTVSVHLGPLWYLRQANPAGYAVGDRVTVTGVAMTDTDHPHWMAYSVTKGDRTMALRDEHGQPVWMAGMHPMMHTMPGDSAHHRPPR